MNTAAAGASPAGHPQHPRPGLGFGFGFGDHEPPGAAGAAGLGRELSLQHQLSAPGHGRRGSPRAQGAARGWGGPGAPAGRRGRRGRAALGVCAGSCPARSAATAPVQSDAASAQLICIRGSRTAPPRLPRPSRPPPGTAPRACPAPPPRPPGTPAQQVRGAGRGGEPGPRARGERGAGGGAGADPPSPGPARRPGLPTASTVPIDPKLDPRAARPPGMPGQGGVAGVNGGGGGRGRTRGRATLVVSCPPLPRPSSRPPSLSPVQGGGLGKLSPGTGGVSGVGLGMQLDLPEQHGALEPPGGEKTPSLSQARRMFILGNPEDQNQAGPGTGTEAAVCRAFSIDMYHLF
ncbi:collagen alpha-1(I) chain-like [Symphalangus syndactylus]|uniref:collagen alpha-1(I) chain-like n=1 Tax=Symphalangus syndactylus TaxID=9590 RepID=UPI0024413B74|nr:collagen alpha-1(I) chain-like [Symphalangus syndactylus]